MGARMVLRTDARKIVESLPGVVDEVEQRALRIAAMTVVLSRMAATHGGRYGAILITQLFRAGARAASARRVAAQGSFAHLDEFGSANNSPTAAMRRAAEREGRLVLG